MSELRVADALESELRAAINRHSGENESNTPDFILARLLRDTLTAFAAASNLREEWYGHRHAPGLAADPPAAPTRAEQLGLAPMEYEGLSPEDAATKAVDVAMASMPVHDGNGPSQEGTAGSDAAPAATAQGTDVEAALIVAYDTDIECWMRIKHALSAIAKLRADLAAAHTALAGRDDEIARWKSGYAKDCVTMTPFVPAFGYLHEAIAKLGAERDAALSALAEAEGDAATRRAINRAAEHLPDDCEIHIEVERGAATVRLILGDIGGSRMMDVDADDRLPAEINAAIDAATQTAGERDAG